MRRNKVRGIRTVTRNVKLDPEMKRRILYLSIAGISVKDIQ